MLFVNQSATSAILMIAVAGTATGSERLSDALIGSGVTLVITVILFPAAPLSLIQDAVQRVSAALRDTLARLAELPGPGETANPGETPRPDWALAVGQRIQRQLTGLQEARSTARQVASLAPRRWPERARVRQAGEQTVALHLLAATVVSLAQACTTGTHGPAAAPPCRARSPGRARVGIRGPGRRRRRQCQPGGPARHPGPGAGGRHCPGGRPRAGGRPALAAGREARRDLR